MNKVTLRELAIVDLNITYARWMGSNNIKHYKVPFVSTVFGDPLQMIKDHIVKEEGPTEFEVLVATRSTLDFMGVSADIEILENYPEVEKALKSYKTNYAVHEQLVVTPMTPKQKRSNLITKPLNKLIEFINECLFSIQRKLYGLDAVASKYHDSIEQGVEDLDTEREYAAIADKIRKRSLSKLTEYQDYVEHRFHPVSFMTVAFEEGQERLAVATLVADLKTCYDRGLILGHLAMPSIMLLADTIGSGKRMYSLFCFPILDNHKILEQSGLSRENAPYQLESLLGLETITREGGVSFLNGVNPKDRYQIEEISVGSKTEENLKAFHDNYKENVPFVNAAADRMSAELKKRKSNG